MSYYFEKKMEGVSFEEAKDQVTAALKEEGFGVLTNIDMTATMKSKLDVDIRPYEILGACNPNFAYKALQEEENIGLMLPCNVVLQDKGDGITVSIIDPLVSMMGIENEALGFIAVEVRGKLQRVIEAI